MAVLNRNLHSTSVRAPPLLRIFQRHSSYAEGPCHSFSFLTLNCEESEVYDYDFEEVKSYH